MSANNSTVLTEVPLETFTNKRNLDAILENKTAIGDLWGSQMVLVDGVLGVPKFFLNAYSRLKPYPLTTGEAMFALQLMYFAAMSRPRPCPSYKILADRMGVSEKMVRRYAKQLHDKAYVVRIGRTGDTNEFDLNGLFAALRLVAEEANKKSEESSDQDSSAAGKSMRDVK